MLFTSGAHRFTLGISARTEATKQQSQGTPRPAITLLGLAIIVVVERGLREWSG